MDFERILPVMRRYNVEFHLRPLLTFATLDHSVRIYLLDVKDRFASSKGDTFAIYDE